MAKEKSLINIQGTFQGKTFVDSRSYGKHVRSPRGTFTPAVLNDACKEAGKSIVSSNISAKILKDAVDPLRADFKDGSLWSRLISHFSTKTDKLNPDFLTLAGFEIHKDHPLSRIVNLELNQIEVEDSALRISIESQCTPRFKNKKINGYRLTVLALYPDLNTKKAEIAIHKFQLETITDAIKTESISLPIPAGASSVLICAKIEGAVNGEISSALSAKGMRILGGVRV